MIPRGNPAAPALLCTLDRGGDGAPLYLVPSAGLTPLSLVRLARAISPRRPVHAFAYAGMEDDAPPHRTLPEMATAYVAELLGGRAQGPYLLGGHCFGGLVALEIALQLEARGEAVACLVVLDAIAPLLADADPGPIGPDRDSRPSAGLEEHVRRALDGIVARTESHYPLLPAEISRRLVRTLRLHVEAGLAYRARRLHAPTHVLRTRECHDAVLAGWAAIAAGGLSRHEVPGDTFSMLQPPHVEAVGRCLGAALQEE
ncbi:MAG TPA: alpha/beta fold hydrolase [Methylomirabilota bacterium]